MPHPRYIVVFKKDAPQAEIDRTKNEIVQSGGKVTHEYGKALNGFAAEIEPLYFNRLSNSLTSSSAIDYIEPDGEVTIQ